MKVSRAIYILISALLIILLIPWVRDLLQGKGMRWLYILLLSSSFTFLLTPLVRRMATGYGVLDIPDARKLHLSPIPLLGGVGIFASFLISIYLNGIFSREFVGVILSASLVFLSGLWDDMRGLSSLFRFFVQCLAVIILLSFGVSVIMFRPEGIGLVLNGMITVVWIVGVTNSMNFFDGMDGLATGLSMLIAFFLGVVAFQTNQPFLGWFAITVFGSCLGFLPYNFRPGGATIFLGDSGSNLLGFTLASLAVMGEWSERNLVASLATPLLIFSVLIYDRVYITVNRFLAGKVKTLKEWLDYVGNDHLHHRMEAILLGRGKSVLFIYLLSFTLGINALVLRDASSVEAWLLLLQATAILIVVTILEVAANRHERRKGYK
ncbi:MAG: undecaprenyl/decaprenyl-phosphate alpha-N-acetylglucosaminyl 1-phosphate transferase [Deltaproteobacteria bacterium]|nr:undecaprenyl/decaprenyl-phosphate alpha-N-acetylglucosaminyl 1-phosphate transferase [Deltaproteobacteria bacterium]